MKGGCLQRPLVSKLCLGFAALLTALIVILSLEEAPVLTIFSSTPEKLKVLSQGFLQQQDQQHLEDSTARQNKNCNYAKGKWVADKKRPLYSGNECKQWLSKMWACRMMQRADFSYENFRWQPHGCEMPEFSGPNILKRGKFNGNHWELYADGKLVGEGRLADLNRAKNLTLYSIARWVDSELVRYPQVKAFLRTISPRHFVNGDWNTGGSCGNTVPLSNGSEVLQDHSSDLPVESAVNGTRVKILDITAVSQLRDEGHISNSTFKGRSSTGINDCLHWCLPGIPDMWNELLFAQI
uniref:Uncharacterized protein n=1 Tax=Oryza punctata TaxID=4537 RepID=A0A0E0M0X1_ORYPU